MSYYGAQLEQGIESRLVHNVNGLTMHLLEAGCKDASAPVVLLLHGFPELAYSWRKIMLPLAAAGYRVLAPDQRGYGLTTGWDGSYDGDLASFRMANLVVDQLALLSCLGIREVAAVVGHDFGSPVAGYCALTRPDVFTRLALMSAPFPGAPPLPFDTAQLPPAEPQPSHGLLLDQQLAALPAPRKHYQWYYSGTQANTDMLSAAQGLTDFMRAYYHSKSADWDGNQPFPLAAATAEELARMPHYYIMQRDADMAATVADYMPVADQACPWLSDSELQVYVEAYRNTEFQGALNWYRCVTDSRYLADLRLFSGRRVDVPSCFIAGASDWGVYQSPGVLDYMRSTVCTRMSAVHLLEGAGHWVQQEQPGAVTEVLLQLLQR